MDETKVPAKNYRDLIVWQDAIKIAKLVYKLPKNFQNMRIMLWQTNSAARLCLCRLTLQKVRQGRLLAIFADSCTLLLVPLQKWIHN